MMFGHEREADSKFFSHSFRSFDRKRKELFSVRRTKLHHWDRYGSGVVSFGGGKVNILRDTVEV